LANTNRKHRLFHISDEAQRIPDESLRADRNEDVHLLYEALAKLPDQQREALVLFEISGFSIVEISELQNAGISAVKQRLARGRKALIALLQENELSQPKNTSV
jgi:RNA polymerase sigma-70 factor (ECF subfamily)